MGRAGVWNKEFERSWEQADFRSPDAVPVRDGEDGTVAFGFDGREEAPHFLLGEEGDGVVLASLVRFSFFGGFDRHCVSRISVSP